MADKCAGCTNKYGFFERPSICPECHRNFCQTCLPYQGKKVKKSQPQVSLEPCVYCRRQKALNKAEEQEILSNFQERYYSRTHTEPPIQSTLRLDMVVRQNSSGASPAQQHKGVEFSEADRALEERLKRLRESSHKSSVPSYSEEEMRAKLEALRQEVNTGKAEGQGGDEGRKDTETETPDAQHTGTTQTEQADRLLEQATDEARIDDKLRHGDKERDGELMKRFQDLKGTGKEARNGSTKAKTLQLNFDVDELFDSMDDPVLLEEEEDAEKLLRDLKSLQGKEEVAAVRELQSEDVQKLIDVARKLAKEEGELEGGTDDPLPNIVYPRLMEAPNLDTPKVAPVSDGEVSSAEVDKMLEEGRDELQQCQEQHEEDLKFAEQTSERLSELRGNNHVAPSDLPEDEVVRSKPRFMATPPNLEFTWSHFGTHHLSSAKSGAEKLGVSDGGFPSEEVGASNGGGGNREEFNDEVQLLIASMLEEAELDSRLEASGVKDTSPVEPKKENEGSANNVPPAGATALPPVPTATGGGVGGACGCDDLPWCCICNDDASISCHDCDGDLYCQRCFTEGHQQFGLVDHKYAPFQPPKK